MSHHDRVHSLRKVFQQSFVVHDITEPLVSFDETKPAADARAVMETRGLEIVGVRIDGQVEGYVKIEDLEEGTCGQVMRPFDPKLVLLDSLPLAPLVLRLREERRLFVKILGRVGGIVSRTDLDKPPVRMWLFGMVTLIEMRFHRLIVEFCPNGSWQEYLSEARVEKARQLLAERSRRNQELALVDCLQLSDKMQIVARNETLRRQTRFQSRRESDRAAKMLEKLRNNLAHAQDVVAHDWEAIVTLAENLDRLLDNPFEPGDSPDSVGDKEPNASGPVLDEPGQSS